MLRQEDRQHLRAMFSHGLVSGFCPGGGCRRDR